MGIEVKWVDRGRYPVCDPNPAYPSGMDVDLSKGASKTCLAVMPTYPAKRCGIFVIKCETCRQVVMVTTAGRADDPRSVKLACKGH